MKTVCAALLVSMMGMASSQTIYRCGVDGRELSQKPCAGGVRVEVAPPTPSAAEQAEARDRAERERTLGDQLEQDRERREALARKGSARAAGFHAAAPAQAASAGRAATRPAPFKTKVKRPPPEQRR